jgi:hypothetical protein
VILKGQRILLEKEHYGEIMEKFLDLNKNYMLFLCNDHEYSSVEPEKEKLPEFINEEEMKMYFE